MTGTPAPEKPAPVQVQLTKEQLEWIDKQSEPWRITLIVAGAVVLIATGVLIAASFLVDVTTTEWTNGTTTSSASASSSGSAAPSPSSAASTTPSPAASPSTSASSPAAAASPAANASNSTSMSSEGDTTTTTKTTTVDGARPSDTVLGLAFALGLLLLLAGAFFNRVTKLSAAGASVEVGPPLPPATQAVVEKKADEVVARLNLGPEDEERFRVGTDALARTLNIRSSVDAETLAELATEGTAKSLKFK